MDDPRPVNARIVELGVMFILAPALLAVFMRPALLFPSIWLLGAICLVVLWRDTTFDRRRLWNWRGVRSGVRRIAFAFAVAAPFLAAALLLYDPASFLSLPMRRPLLWVVIMVGYPIASVYAQELAFRTFFFHRYACLFRRRWAMILASAAAFGLAHIILHNWVAVLFSVPGGVLFAHTYDRTRSLAASCIEHALYGCYVFTIGWGAYFYAGSLAR